MSTGPHPDRSETPRPAPGPRGVPTARPAAGGAAPERSVELGRPAVPAGPDQPGWLTDLAEALSAARPDDLSRARAPAAGDARPAAVLMVLADGPNGADILLIQRAPDLRSHGGQPAFPGGATDPTDVSPAATALREAHEEVGLDPKCVRVVATGPALYLPPSHFLVTPVLAWWHTPCPVAAMDPNETSSVARVPVATLADPANRLLVHHARTGYLGPAFRAHDMFIWGFTGGLLDALLRMGGWERPWLPAEQVEAPAPVMSVPTRSAHRSAHRQSGAGTDG
ncbi:CoA pyrophosphatase [Frankia sp. Cr1]|uniref:NUDIX hydrolase n=1 Tax=Frankia sp. Cr1 TaxID=3073931 RepID=UPI002AD2114D|nr:CoA pyrophosphatase [Frankia sp. Cr1]